MNLELVCRRDPQWIMSTLQTIPFKHRNIQQLSISSPETLKRLLLSIPPEPAAIQRALGEEVYMRLLELDRLLTQLHELHSIYLKVFLRAGRAARSHAKCLLPEVVTRGVVDLGSSVL